MRVYLAHPYTSDPDGNAERAIDVADQLMDMGHIVLNPLLSHYHHKRRQRSYESWMVQDFGWLDVCDVLVRVLGDSPGADREVARAQELGIPVYTLDEFLAREAFRS